MLWLITGARGCGKSGFAEQRALSADPAPLYIATLPRCDATLARILAHERRRCAVWSLMEANATWSVLRRDVAARLCGSKSVLLDGLSSLLWLQTMAFGARAANLRAVTLELRDMLDGNVRRGGQVVVVDCAVPFPHHSSDFWFNALVREVHAGFCEIAQWRHIEPSEQFVERGQHGRP